MVKKQQCTYTGNMCAAKTAAASVSLVHIIYASHRMYNILCIYRYTRQCILPHVIQWLRDILHTRFCQRGLCEHNYGAKSTQSFGAKTELNHDRRNEWFVILNRNRVKSSPTPPPPPPTVISLLSLPLSSSNVVVVIIIVGCILYGATRADWPDTVLSRSNYVVVAINYEEKRVRICTQT